MITYRRTDACKRNYITYRKKSDETIPILIDFLKTELDLKETDFKLPTKYQDTNQGIDIFIKNTPVALRYRELQYINYDDITIRYNSGNKSSEATKIICGKNKTKYYFFYYIADGKIKEIRAVETKTIQKCLEEEKYSFRCNGDKSNFVVIKLSDVKDGLIIRKAENNCFWN